MSRTGDALRKASSTVSEALGNALAQAGAEGQPTEISDAINAGLLSERAGNGGTGAVNACLALADKADKATLKPPPPDDSQS